MNDDEIAMIIGKDDDLVYVSPWLLFQSSAYRTVLMFKTQKICRMNQFIPHFS